MGKYLDTADSDWYKQRIAGVMVCVVTTFIVLFVRLLYLQVIEGEELRRLSENNCIRLQSIDAPRGLVFDRNGKMLVDNRPSFDLFMNITDDEPLDQIVEKISRRINVPKEELMERLARNKGKTRNKPLLLRKDIGRDALASIEVHKFDLPGVLITVRPLRHYINKQSASHIIGYLSEISAEELKHEKYAECKSGDFIGKFGVEKAYEQFLRGKRGGRQVEVNATGQVVRVLKTVDAHPGHNVYLTIDQTLQTKAEVLLEGKVGAVAAMNPTTGHVLALASSPSFDQNAFVSGMSHEQWNALISNPFRPMENKAFQGEYPPASTYKIVTAIAGLEEGVIDENTSFFCPGYYKFGDRVFLCWKKEGHGNVKILKALAQSCDVFFYQVGQRLGVDRIAQYAKASGLGSPTGINLDHEARGLIPTSTWKKNRTGISWQGGETLSVAIGQGYNLVTPLQMLVLTSALAQEGKIYKPLIIKKVETAGGEIVKQSNPQLAGVLPAGEKTLAIVKKGLWQVVNEQGGTARRARVQGINISGKTGTAQVVSRKKDDETREPEPTDHLKSHAWFVSYAPSEEPQIAVAVLVEHGGHGSSAAAPIARELIKTYLLSDERGLKVSGKGRSVDVQQVASNP
ncbi:penicillin-binding protein 2 [Thermodesulfobacteriota bacterium]